MNNIDASLTNADWTKRSWDLPKDIDHYHIWYGYEDDLREYVAHLLTLPVSKAMPDELRAAFAKELPDLFPELIEDESAPEEEEDPVQALTSLLAQLEALKDRIAKT